MDKKKVTFELEINDNGCISLPPVGRIQGAMLDRHGTPKESFVHVQYESPHTKQWMELRIPLLDALYLLNILEAMSAANNLDVLRRPPKGSA